jgi:glucokinase-like ROK family protein
MRGPARKATRELTEAHNRHLVLRTIYDEGQISRAGIARATELTRTTVSDMVDWLMRQGLVEEAGYGPSAGGKPPILLKVVDDSRHLIGIDLAQDEFCGAVANLRGEIRHQVSLPLDGRDGEAALGLVYDLVHRLVTATESPLLGIGIGTPGLMDPLGGVVRQAVNLDWQDLPLGRRLQERFGLPVHVANDCQVAALAEHTFGEGRGLDNLAVIKIEHGIGAGIVLNGQLFHGDTFGAGELGHVTVVENGQPCRCGNFGCLETVSSAWAIVQQAQIIAQNDPHSPLHRFASSPEKITLREVWQAAEAGDQAVRETVVKAGRCLGIALANLVAVLSLRRILFAGSVTCFGTLLLDVMRQEMLRRSLAPVARETQLGLSSMGPDMVILGASALVLTGELGLFAPLVNQFQHPTLAPYEGEAPHGRETVLGRNEGGAGVRVWRI